MQLKLAKQDGEVRENVEDRRRIVRSGVQVQESRHRTVGRNQKVRGDRRRSSDQKDCSQGDQNVESKSKAIRKVPI